MHFSEATMMLEHIEPKILRRRVLDRTAPDNSDSDQFDTNMLIILAVLLCTALLTLALNTFARCGLHYRLLSSSSPSSAEQPSPPPPPGLNKRALCQLPVAVYGSGPGISSKECTICLGEFVNGERIRVLPKCRHGFHVGCIDTWLISPASCPNCRVSLLEPRPSTLIISSQ